MRIIEREEMSLDDKNEIFNKNGMQIIGTKIDSFKRVNTY